MHCVSQGDVIARSFITSAKIKGTFRCPRRLDPGALHRGCYLLLTGNSFLLSWSQIHAGALCSRPMPALELLAAGPDHHHRHTGAVGRGLLGATPAAASIGSLLRLNIASASVTALCGLPGLGQACSSGRILVFSSLLLGSPLSVNC